MDNIGRFLKVLYEAPDDAPPDIGDTGPPEMPDVSPDTAAPDMPEADMGMPDEMGGTEDDMFGMGDEENQDPNDPNQQPQMELDEKISAIMNQQLYQRYLALLNTITNQLSSIKNNSDVLLSISKESIELIDKIKKLDENVRLYIKNSFLHENYSKNLLFFNKCLNLLKLLNNEFDRVIHKGINSME